VWYAVILPVPAFDSSGFKFEMESLKPWQSVSYFLSFETYPVLFSFLFFPFFWLDLFIFTVRFYFISHTTRRNIFHYGLATSCLTRAATDPPTVNLSLSVKIRFCHRSSTLTDHLCHSHLFHYYISTKFGRLQRLYCCHILFDLP